MNTGSNYYSLQEAFNAFNSQYLTNVPSKDYLLKVNNGYKDFIYDSKINPTDYSIIIDFIKSVSKIIEDYKLNNC